MKSSEENWSEINEYEKRNSTLYVYIGFTEKIGLSLRRASIVAKRVDIFQWWLPFDNIKRNKPDFSNKCGKKKKTIVVSAAARFVSLLKVWMEVVDSFGFIAAAVGEILPIKVG